MLGLEKRRKGDVVGMGGRPHPRRTSSPAPLKLTAWQVKKGTPKYRATLNVDGCSPVPKIHVHGAIRKCGVGGSRGTQKTLRMNDLARPQQVGQVRTSQKVTPADVAARRWEGTGSGMNSFIHSYIQRDLFSTCHDRC